MKFCTDCRWCTLRDGIYRCEAPQNRRVKLHPIDASMSQEWRNSWCSGQRSSGWLGSLFRGECGRGARWFKPKGPA